MRPPERESWKIASISGHRNLSPQGKARVRKAMVALLKKDAVDAIYFGGARGTDTLALQAAAEVRVGLRPHLVVVVPDKAESQPFEARQWFHLADEVIELGNPIASRDRYQAFRIRNQYLVDVATLLIAFFNGDQKTGTGQAIRMAEEVGLRVVLVPV